MQGKFIAIYGINNIGKSTQTALLLQRLIAAGIRTEYVKYPIYNLDPTGKKLNEILRGKEQHNVQSMINFFEGTKVRKPATREKKNVTFSFHTIAPKELRQRVTEQELQMWYSLNRYQYDPTIQKKLESGVTILAEDYTGTGLAWGAAKGADLEWLVNVNKFLCPPDIEILLDGERFLIGKEKVHLHESSDRLIEKARKSFQLLAKRYNWEVVNANQSIQEVARDLWKKIEPVVAEIKPRQHADPLANWRLETEN
ncbi:MAG: hypothetical protein WC304_04290 [Candidatus Gracilibacteria bacterium]|jgi:thymidylate kinase